MAGERPGKGRPKARRANPIKDGFTWPAFGIGRQLHNHLYNVVPPGQRRAQMMRYMLLGFMADRGVRANRADFVPPPLIDVPPPWVEGVPATVALASFTVEAGSEAGLTDVLGPDPGMGDDQPVPELAAASAGVVENRGTKPNAAGDSASSTVTSGGAVASDAASTRAAVDGPSAPHDAGTGAPAAVPPGPKEKAVKASLFADFRG